MLRLFALCLSFCLISTATYAENYPQAVRKSFLESCASFHKELLPPCLCMIREFQKQIPYKDFVKLSNAKDPMADKRFAAIGTMCKGAK